jgi:hypothetical protein
MNFLSGDFRFFWLENIKDFATLPFAWDSSLNTGIGASQLSSLWITSFFNFTAFFSRLGLSWSLIQLFFWILPAILLSFFCSFFLFKTLFKFKVWYPALAGIIYALNTYFLMILTGGQIGVSLSYSIAPLVLLGFIKIAEKPSLKTILIGGLILGFQIMLDPRISYITLIAVFFYLLFNFSKLKTIRSVYRLLSPFVIVFLLNSFWIIPLVLAKNSSFPVGFDSVSGFKFFSFAKLENSISLLHPNWPENIFGKVYFLDPKFLILPIVAFSSLFFVSKIKDLRIKTYVLFFSLVGLLGAFLAKGANEPLGIVNEFLFKYLPGMTMFRDPTKWYMLIALSYSILIPYAIRQVSKYFRFTFILFVIYFLYLATPIFKQIKISHVPQEYVQLKDFLNNQKAFSRTLWIPQWQRFGYFSNNHPAIGREELLKGNVKKQISLLDQNLLEDFSIKYVVIPYDLQSEIFLKDRKYDASQFNAAVAGLKKIPWLEQKNGFGKIEVFEVPSPKDHFWTTSEKLSLQYKYISSVEYRVEVKNAKKNDLLVFSEGYDKNWTAIISSKSKVKSQKFDGKFNSFILPEGGNYTLDIYYEPQKWVNIGLWISGSTLLVIVGFLGFGYISKKW